MSEGWHNRWHPGIEPAGEIEPGVAVTIETREGTDGAITADSTSEALTRLDFSRAHQLPGPYFVKGAEPGDLLEVELLEVTTRDFGWTGVLPGFGGLADEFSEPYILKWALGGGYARSEDLPGIAVPEAAFPGVVGVAPTLERVAEIRERDAGVIAAGGAVIPDQPEGAIPKLAAAGLRTIPPREFGGNIDIKQVRVGAKLLLPVQVPGALLSIGDLHFSQGDGEVCGSGIECGGVVTLRTRIIRDSTWRPRLPSFTTPGEPARACLATTGIPEGPPTAELDLMGAVRSALGEMLSYLTSVRELERPAAYALMSAVVDLRISQIVNMPNPLVSAFLPLDIFVD